MAPKTIAIAIAALAVALVPGDAAAAVWGSFDASRINYAGGVLSTGADHDELRMVIMGAGDTLAPGTPIIDAAYLSGVDVFYTSLPDNSDPPLSAAEQTALQSWITAGGTLIVTADANPLPTYESFTQFYGVTGYVVDGSVTATPVGMHPLTAGVSNIDGALQVTFSYGPDAAEVAVNDVGNTFGAVLDPSTGFCGGGKILVWGDHNLFADGYIGNVDNLQLATNMVAWVSSTPGGGCNCGNGIIDPGEACDDANVDNTDGCVAGCQLASCGDGFVHAGVEDCDDGNLDDTDACLSTCDAASCGDGFVHAGVEDCDDGNMDDTDACTAGCSLAFCGDGYVWAGMEECDDANLDATDACVPGCMNAACGDGNVWAGVEDCDDGNMIDSDACTSACMPATCGDGFVQAGVEQCDDGNTLDSDDCVGDCVDAVCGDSYVWDGMEECDDGNLEPGDGCDAECVVEAMGSTGGSTGGDTGGSGDAGSDGSSGGSGGDGSGGDGSGGGDSTGGGSTSGASDGSSGGIPFPDLDNGAEDGGCSCTTAPRRAAPRAWLWGLVLLGLRRRRRRDHSQAVGLVASSSSNGSMSSL